MSNTEINTTYIVALKEEAGKFYKVTIPIKKPELFIAELSAMVDNPNRTLWDMQSHFQAQSLVLFPKAPLSINYIGSKNYNSSYVSNTKYPILRGYEDLSKSWSEAAQQASTEYAQQCKTKGILQDKSILSSLVEKAIAELKNRQKRDFIEKVMEWIHAWSYQETANYAEQSTSIKMYSKANIGWHTFHHSINDDIKIELHTNFGYGSASYFLLGIKYKKLAILPYSHIVKYYKVSMADIIKCTRSFQAWSDSWCASFDFLSDFINSSIENPESFVKRYIMCEVEEMMQGLEAIAYNPKKYMDKLGNIKADPCVIYVRPMFSDEKRRMAAYPSETPILFKVEKITDALDFLCSLTEISQYIRIQKHINRLLELNMALVPEIEDAVRNNTKRIEKHNSQKESIETQIATLANKLRPFEEEMENLQKALPTDQHFSIIDYKDTHPQYKDLIAEKSKLSIRLYEVNQIINDLSSFNSVLHRSLKKVNEIKDLSEAT